MVKPLYDRILVRPDEPEEITKGGIIIPDTAKQKPEQGKVVAVGDGAIDKDGNIMPMTLKVGDTVLYSKFTGTDIEVENETLMIMRDGEVFAIAEQ